jgi:hypothetical protein
MRCWFLIKTFVFQSKNYTEKWFRAKDQIQSVSYPDSDLVGTTAFPKSHFVVNTPLGNKYKCKHETVVMQVVKISILSSVFVYHLFYWVRSMKEWFTLRKIQDPTLAKDGKKDPGFSSSYNLPPWSEIWCPPLFYIFWRTCRKVPFQVNFFRWQYFPLVSI